MENNEKSFWQYVLGRIAKYAAINIGAFLAVCLLGDILLSMGIYDSTNEVLTICLFAANCTGILFGKLHKIQKLLEEREEESSKNS